jgi:phage gpG-like protein
MAASLKLEGLDVLVSHLDPEIVRPIVRRYLLKSAIVVQRAARKKAPKFQGTLAKSIVYNVTPVSAEIGTNLVYGAATEFGRPPGAPPPPPGALLPWMARKGIPAEMEYFLGQTISMFGTTPQPYLGPAMDENADVILGDMLDAVAREIEAVTSV